MAVVAAVLVVVTLIVLTAGWTPPVIALGSAVVIAGLLGIAPPRELFSGLSNGGVITVGAMLVIAKGIVQTGLVDRLTRALLMSVTSARSATLRLALPLGVASGLMNTTPIVAMLVPASKQLEQTRSIPARELMLPLAHLTTLTGSITLIGTSSNLLIAGIADDGGVTMTMLSFAPVALPVALAGLGVLIVTGPRMLRGSGLARPERREWHVEIPIGEGALAADRTADELGLGSARDYRLTSVRRDGDALTPETVIAVRDILVFQATEAGIRALWASPVFGLSAQRLFAVSVRTGATGTLNDLGMDDDIEVIAARTTTSLHRTELVPGATCYVAAHRAEIVDRSEYVTLWQDVASRVPQPRNTWKAVTILGAVVLPASFGLAPIELTSVGGALLMVLTGVLTPRSAARALDGNMLGILAGSVGLGVIVLESGLADVLAHTIQGLVAGSAALVIVVFGIVTVLLTNVVSNAAAAAILTPVAIAVAVDVQMDPVILLALVGTCISFTFLNPFAHQTNLMVIGPIGYTRAEFTRFGTPLLVVGLVIACAVGTLLVSLT
ncbi:putative Transporter, sodium/sulfate symporter family [Nostocoides japonicum T1-X7]|uniref:Putative Transporter, sodium/sulfate symporter family n=1 Tax=Nostocoides japonicum T1-X7 TaxID=1194083 RepID=A0A077M4J5_9MICO|nr:SLC13 family permease [Tetrasphaera japonica]CCH79049.1 putative Transporter, sodium/sulfate symporter family [Tetrasphaera japonica T1-X7]